MIFSPQRAKVHYLQVIQIWNINCLFHTAYDSPELNYELKKVRLLKLSRLKF